MDDCFCFQWSHRLHGFKNWATDYSDLTQIPKLGNRPRPYSRSEVIHRAGDESLFPAFERERPRIVNNFAASASSGYEFSSISEKMNSTRLSNLAVVLGSGNEYSDEDESSLGACLARLERSCSSEFGNEAAGALGAGGRKRSEDLPGTGTFLG